MKRKMLSYLLVLVLMFQIMPTNAIALDNSIIADGICGNNLTWKIDKDGVLTISGIGDMNSYYNINNEVIAPWYDYNDSIHSIVISDGVTSIGSYAFQYCTMFTSLSIGSSVAKIGSYAFRGCTSLISVEIPDDVTEIGSYAFSGCTGLVSVKTGKYLKYIGNDVFRDCINLTRILYNTEKIDRLFAQYVFANAGTASSGIVVTFGDNVEIVPSYLFDDNNISNYRSKIKAVIFGKKVSSIGDYAFRNCTEISNITIGENTTIIGSGAFYNCKSLKSITIPDNVTTIGRSAFRGCTELEGLTIGYGVTSIGDYAFSDCSCLSEIIYNAKVITSNSHPFVNIGTSDSAIALTISSGVEKIPAGLFYGCTGISAANIPDSVTTIGEEAFYGCTGLKSVTIGKNVDSIGDYAFSDCSCLSEIIYNAKVITSNSHPFVNIGTSDSAIALTISSGVEKIPAGLFYGCTGISAANIPDSVTTIGEEAFYGCTGLKSVTIGKNVDSIGAFAFENCAALKTITIGSNVNNIGNFAFGGCTGLTEIIYNAKSVVGITSSSHIFSQAGKATEGVSVIFSDNVEIIPAYLFYDSSSSRVPNLKSITIGKNVSSIGSLAFYGCTRLTEIYYNAKAVSDLTSSSKIFYNAGTSGDGMTVVFGETVKKIPAHLFYSGYDKPKISKVVFCRDAPTVGENSFASISTTAYYPYGNETWVKENRIYRYGSGYFEWKSYSDTEIESCECNILKGNYILGESLDIAGIIFTITRVDGCVENYDYSSGEITLGEYNMTTAGWHTIIDMCKGEKAELKIYIHDVETTILDSANYPESSHNYDNNLDKTYMYSIPDAAMLKVTFSASTMVETNVDYIYINGIQYTGNELADKTVEISGNTLEIRLVSDSTDTEYGFSIVKIEALITVHEYTEHIIASTCKYCGIKTYTCSVCGYSRTETIPLSSNHSYQETWSFDGIIHWHECSVCQDKKDIETHNGGTSTCKQKAVCEECGVEYGDYAKHKLTKHKKVEPTVDSEGNIEYWICDECGKYFSEAEGKNEITVDDTVIGKLTIKKLTYLGREVLIEVPSNAVPEDFEITVDKIVPPPAEIVEKVKDTYGESSEVLAYYEIRLFDENGDRIYKLDSEITIKSILPEKYQTGYIIKISQEDDDGNLVEMESWREGEYICYNTDWLEKY